MRNTQLALLGVFAIITEIDGPMTSSRQQCVMSCFARLSHNGDALLVARYEHSHMVRHLHLQT